ncbi:hypothetical protein JW960_02215 [candidate division KSB1 bacterium]|nr:hypothetical protein [candidate division KSB1 bacterium]
MKLVVVILNQVDLVEDLLSAFLEIGISGATVLDSTGMGRILTTQIPIFAGLRDAFAGCCPQNKTIISIIQENQLRDMEIVLNEVCGDFENKGTGIYFTIPVDNVKGFKGGY